ncbi:Leucine-rich repeat (LRR) protein [Streptococcus gallinaceus]|uniref:pneumococcal-type histidine triad protein n=1 Tax=Streptococcus gallinaceus TaxID=165758 RepID=UPI00209D1AED|nr:Leucine-rich repeat (LRR) protein [Streptococcus gallinaceus]MCP1770324.1 Leucine-rich repeat (LRR) protein [Streptococcus gallinaceus]
MKKNNRIMYLVGITLSCQLVLTACHIEQKQTTNQSYKVEKQVSKTDKVSEEELVVVTAIKKEGYLRLQGGDSYFVQGQVPYRAMFLKETLPDKSYTFKKEDIFYKVEQGYIISVNGHYHYYPKEKDANIISLKYAKKLTKNQKRMDAKGVAGIDFPTDDGFLFEKESQIISKTDDGLVIDHDGHSHFIFYKDLQNSKWAYLIPNQSGSGTSASTKKTGEKVSSGVTLDDGYVFDPKDIVAEDENGYTVRHGDHFHYIWKKDLSGTELPKVSPRPLGHLNSGETGQALAPSSKKNQSNGSQIPSVPSVKKRFPGVDYPTSDGFQFNGSGVQGQTSLGLLVDHHGHTHLIPYSHLVASKWESHIPQVYLEVARKEYQVLGTVTEKDLPPVSPQKPQEDETAKQIQSKKEYLAHILGLSADSIKVADTEDGPVFVYPHGDHSHAILIDKVDIGKPIDDPHQDPHAHDKIGMATLKSLGFDDEIIEDILHATADQPFPSTETDPERMKEWLLTVKYLNIGQRTDPLKRKNLDLMPNLEVLGIGFTKIDDVRPVLQFKNLKQIWMTQTGIKDFTFLKELPQLEGIDISQNEITDLSFLKDFTHLKVVAAAGNNLTDLSPLSQLSKLESLNLDYNRISDLTPISHLTNLTAVSLEHNNLSDISALSNKDKLNRLFLSYNEKIDLSTLKAEKLEELTATNSKVSNLEFLKNNPSLRELNLTENQLTNLKGVEEAEKLKTLSVERNHIETLAIDGEQTSVETLNVSGNQLTNLEGINHYTALENLNASNNTIETLKLSETNQSLQTIDVSKNHIPQEELVPNSEGIPQAIAQNFPEVKGGDISENTPKEEVASTDKK